MRALLKITNLKVLNSFVGYSILAELPYSQDEERINENERRQMIREAIVARIEELDK